MLFMIFYILCTSYYLLMVILKGTWEYFMTISGGLKYLTEEISFRKNILHHLTPHVPLKITIRR